MFFLISTLTVNKNKYRIILLLYFLVYVIRENNCLQYKTIEYIYICIYYVVKSIERKKSSKQFENSPVLRKMISKVNGSNAHLSNTITLFTNFLRTTVEVTTSLMAHTRDFEDI